MKLFSSLRYILSLVVLISSHYLMAQSVTSATVSIQPYGKKWIQTTNNSNDTAHISNKFITIKFKKGQFENCKKQLTSLGLVFRDRPVNDYCLFELPQNCDLQKTMARIGKQKSIELVIPDVLGKATLTSDDYFTNYTPNFWFGPDYNDPNYPADQLYLNLANAWNITTGNPNVRIAIIDNGMKWGEPDLPPDNQLGYNFIQSNTNTTVTGNPCIATHGTSMLSVICAKTNNGIGMYGVAGGWTDANNNYQPGVTPVSLVIRDTYGDDSDDEYNNSHLALLPSAITFAAQVGVKVILIPIAFHNLTTEQKQPVIDAIDAVLNNACNQLVIVASTGDGGHISQHNNVNFPANYAPVIAVSGVDPDHMQFHGLDTYASNGPELDFVTGGYGTHIIHCPFPQEYFKVLGGTSYSAALLAGSIGLLYSVNPNLTYQQVMELLKSSCYKATNLYTFNANGRCDEVGYGFPNIRLAIDNLIQNNHLHTITTSQPWNSNVTSNGILIKAGATLTLNNMTLGMAPGSKIVIEPGAKLIANYSTITKACPTKTWQGIEVWGDRTKNQLQTNLYGYYFQGYLELNNSTVEYSICAADLWKPGDYSTTGGIIKASNSFFRNNTRSIHACHYKNMHPYHPKIEMSYFGRIDNCVFEITPNYIPDQTFYKHVDLADVKGFTFQGCDFTLAPNVTGVSDWNQAIAAYSAGFSATALCTTPNQQPCTTWDRCSFAGFQWGINATKTLSNLNSFTVNNAVFNNNIIGVNVNTIKNQSIINSDFHVGYNPGNGTCTTNASYGIYLEQSSGFAIEDNTFQKLTGSPMSVYNGINVTNSVSADQIYRNTFTGLSYANLAQLKNWMDEYKYGLTYFCNNNYNNWADFFVVPDGNPDPLVISGIGSLQGNDDLVTGNKFSQSASTRWHFYNGGDYLVGYYYNANQPDEDPYDNPDPNLSKIFYVTDKAKQLSNSCPSHYGGGGGISIDLSTAERAGRELQFAQALTNYNNVKSLYDKLIDGGSTTGTLTDIGTAQPQDMWALRGQLLGASPHLSMEVLEAVANRTDVFPHSAIFDILAANPDELRKNELMDYLATTQNPMPEYMINILRSVAEGSTYKTVLLNQMAQYNREKTNAANDIIRSILNSEETDYNDLRNWLDNLGGPEADRQIIASYLHENDYTAALNLANMQPQLYAFNATEIAANDALIQLINLYQTLYNEGRQLDALTQTELNLLTAIAAINPSEARGIARGILSAYSGANYGECFNLPEVAAYKKGQVTPEVYADIYRMEIAVSPNPASTWAAFDYRLPDFESAGLLEITDVTGRVLLTAELHDAQGQYLLDTRLFNSGMYLFTFTSGKARKTGKFAVVK